MTSHGAVFAAPSRVLWAIDSGFSLKVDRWRVQHWAGWHANVETLIVLHEIYGMQWTEAVSRGAAESGDVDKLRWLLDEQHCPQAEDICDHAAMSGNTEALEWFRERGCMFTANTCAKAVLVENDIEVLTYLHSAGCEWDESTMTNAARHGDIGVLQLLHKQARGVLRL
eukprot:8906-Heterococcus_DN1.PRE.9